MLAAMIMGYADTERGEASAHVREYAFAQKHARTLALVYVLTHAPSSIHTHTHTHSPPPLNESTSTGLESAVNTALNRKGKHIVEKDVFATCKCVRFGVCVYVTSHQETG